MNFLVGFSLDKRSLPKLSSLVNALFCPMEKKFYYQGLPSLNGTIVPDAVFDELMPVCSGAEFKVLCYIVRRTFGFKKESDSISLRQMIEGIRTKDGKVLDQGTGLSKGTAAVAVKGLIEKGIITVLRNRSAEKGDEPTTYRLRFAKEPVSENRTRGVSKIGHPRVRKSDTQTTDIQTTDIQTTDIQYRNISKSKLSENTGTSTQGSLGLTPIGSLLKQPFIEKPPGQKESKPTPAIKAAVTEISVKLANASCTKANITQAMRIYLEWGKGEEAFVSKLYEVQSITRQQPQVKKPMPYFFKVLRKELGVEETTKGD